MECNVLFTGAGRHVSLIRQFRRALKHLGIEGKLLAADVSEYVAGMWIADERRKLPEARDGRYVDALKEICANDGVRLVVPLVDEDLLPLALHRHEFMAQGSLVLVSDPDTIQICMDRSLTHDFFAKHGIDCPAVHDLGEVLAGAVQPGFPLVLKPATGAAWNCVTVAETANDLMFYARKLHDPLLEECVRGMEFTFDVYVGLDGVARTVVPRLRIEVRNGEVLQSMTCLDTEISDKAREVVDNLSGPLGPLTVHGILTDSGALKFLGVSPRYAGGAPLSILAGADSPLWILSELLGLPVPWNGVVVQDRCLMMRYHQEVLIDNPAMAGAMLAKPAPAEQAQAASVV